MLRAKVFILLVLGGVIPLFYHSPPATQVGAVQILLYAFKVSGTLCLAVTAYTFYGWRVPGLSYAATFPNIRGTWRIDEGAIHDVKTMLQLPNEPKAYVVLQQTDPHIRLLVLWDDGEMSQLVADTPAVAHQGKYAFAGTYVSQPGGIQHGLGGYIAYTETAPNTFTLWYRTDDGLTGRLIAKGPVPRQFKTLKDAQANYAKPVACLRKIWFTLKPR
jgi:hypothetical protein